VTRAEFFRGVLRIAVDRRAPFSATVFPPHQAPSRRRLIRVKARLRDGRRATLKTRVRTCPNRRR
jgi:hypothetical protein